MSATGSDYSLPSCLSNTVKSQSSLGARGIPGIKVALKSMEHVCLQHSLTDAAVETSRVWCKRQTFAQNRIATAFAHTVVNPCNKDVTNAELGSRFQSAQGTAADLCLCQNGFVQN